MFSSLNNPLKAYQDVGLEITVASASPHKLILMLFEGANEAINRAKVGIEQNDTPKKGLAISKAIDIILNGLQSSINREDGGKLSEDLYALYDYMGRRLLHANAQNDIAALNEVSSLLGEIHSAWQEIGNDVKNASST